jgi:hypothetical protein
MWKRIAAVGASAGALVAAGLIGAAPASASSTHTVANPDGQPNSGLGQFASQGEWFYACDLRGDSFGVKVDWHVVSNPSNNGSAWDRDSGGDCASSNASVAEGNEVAYRICFTHNGVEVSCTGYYHDYA